MEQSCKRTQPQGMVCLNGQHDGPCTLTQASPLDETPVTDSLPDGGLSYVPVNGPELAEAFRKWDAAYRTHPEQFWSTVQHLIGSSTYEYGEACAEYLMHLLRGGDPLA